MKTNVKKSDKIVDVKKLQGNDKVEEIDTEALIAEAQKKVDDLKAQLSEAKADLRKLSGKSGKEKGPGVISSILSLVTESGKTGISKTEILDKLCEMFPDRARDGMEKTIGVQLPSRMSKEKKVNIIKENDRYLIK